MVGPPSRPVCVVPPSTRPRSLPSGAAGAIPAEFGLCWGRNAYAAHVDARTLCEDRRRLPPCCWAGCTAMRRDEADHVEKTRRGRLPDEGRRHRRSSPSCRSYRWRWITTRDHKGARRCPSMPIPTLQVPVRRHRGAVRPLPAARHKAEDRSGAGRSRGDERERRHGLRHVGPILVRRAQRCASTAAPAGPGAASSGCTTDRRPDSGAETHRPAQHQVVRLDLRARHRRLAVGARKAQIREGVVTGVADL